jgi:hypothetical protein
MRTRRDQERLIVSIGRDENPRWRPSELIQKSKQKENKMDRYQRLEWEQRVLDSLSEERLQEHFPQGYSVEAAREAPDGSVWVQVFDGQQSRAESVAYDLLV